MRIIKEIVTFIVVLAALTACQSQPSMKAADDQPEADGVRIQSKAVNSRCYEKNDCEPGLACVAGQCVLDCQGDACPSEGLQCVTDSQCSAGLFCMNSRCARAKLKCETNAQCPKNHTCLDGECAFVGKDAGK